MKALLFSLFLLAMMYVNVALADTDEPSTWEIVERCLPDPIVPPDDWTFDGEILLWGWAGIHGINASLDVPYVAHWGGGVLSPDGQWILQQEVNAYTEQLSSPGPLGRYHIYYGDIVAVNLISGERQTFDWEANYSITSQPYILGPAGPLWLDDHHFIAIYGTFGHETRMGDVETGEIVDWLERNLDDYEISISPDQTRLISYAYLYDLADNSQLIEQPVGTSHDFLSSAWSHDSSMFIDVIKGEDQLSSLTLYDRDGTVTAVPFVGAVNSMSLDQWSRADDYFAFTTFRLYGAGAYEGHTFIMDLHEEVIYDLCVEDTQGWAWSPDGTQFATVLGRGQQPVVITDLNEWQPYIVAYHTGDVIFWRSLAD
jgi:hypothetical protein